MSFRGPRWEGRLALHVMVLGHTVVLPDNRVRWKRLAELFPETHITVVPPVEWEVKGDQGKKFTVVTHPEQQDNYRVAPLPYSFLLGKYDRWHSLASHLKRMRPDIIWAIADQINPALWQILLYRRIWASQAVVISSTNDNIGYKPERLRHKLREYLVFRESDAAIAENPEAADILRNHGFDKPILVQPAPGSDENKWRPMDTHAARQRLGVKGFVIGFVGGFRPEKGVPDLVKAVLNLDVDWTLVLVGDGSERSTVEQMLEAANMSHRARFAGFVPRPETPLYYNAMDVLVSCARRRIILWVHSFHYRRRWFDLPRM
jgi:glycosyltransferase involved in cell wall biosynthesis